MGKQKSMNDLGMSIVYPSKPKMQFKKPKRYPRPKHTPRVILRKSAKADGETSLSTPVAPDRVLSVAR